MEEKRCCVGTWHTCKNNLEVEVVCEIELRLRFHQASLLCVALSPVRAPAVLASHGATFACHNHEDGHKCAAAAAIIYRRCFVPICDALAASHQSFRSWHCCA